MNYGILDHFGLFELTFGVFKMISGDFSRISVREKWRHLYLVNCEIRLSKFKIFLKTTCIPHFMNIRLNQWFGQKCTFVIREMTAFSHYLFQFHMDCIIHTYWNGTYESLVLSRLTVGAGFPAIRPLMLSREHFTRFYWNRYIHSN